MGAAPRRHARWWLGGVVAVLLAVAPAVVGGSLLDRWLPDPDQLRRTVEQPAPGDVLADHVDGRPVFVVGLVGGGVRVLDAISTHAPKGQPPKVLAWCRTSQTFEDLWSAARFDLWGNWLGGPAASGLALWPVVEISGGRVEVGPPGVAPLRDEVQGVRMTDRVGPSCDVRTALYLDGHPSDPTVLEDLVVHVPESASFRYPTPDRVLHGPR